MILKQDLGDTRTYELPLTWDDEPATLEEGEIIIFTAKYKASDTDAESAFQKALGTGLSVTGSVLTLNVLRIDTVNIAKGVTLVCDAQATKVDGTNRTLWKGRLQLSRDITRETSTSTTVHSTESPLPVILPGWEVVEITAAAYEALTTEEQEDPMKIYTIIS